MAAMTKNDMKPTCHRDGTVSYWSVSQQKRIYGAHIVPASELEAMSIKDRDRVLHHVDRFYAEGMEAIRKWTEAGVAAFFSIW
jgi:hypothetical protein